MIDKAPEYGKVVGIIEFKDKIIVAAEYGVFELIEKGEKQELKQIQFVSDEDNG